MDTLTKHTTMLKGQHTTYYTGGSPSGVPIIFLHGWPDLAAIWKHQLLHFSSPSVASTNGTGYRVIAPDLRGYGDSSAPSDRRAYRLELLVAEILELLGQLNIQKAVWVAHDWGCGLLSALAAHHPEVFLGAVFLSVPYRSIELGIEHLVSLVNRDIYPEDEYEFGQWAYMKFYEQETELSVKQYDAADPSKLVKIFLSKSNPSTHGKPAPFARIIKDGGFFGGHPEMLPDIPLEATCLDEELYALSVKSHLTHGFFPATAWYLNHDVNVEYAKSEKNGGVLEFPVLYVDAKYDSVCSSTSTPKLGENQRKFVKDLTEVFIESGHWVQVEKKEELNEAMEKWLATKV